MSHSQPCGTGENGRAEPRDEHLKALKKVIGVGEVAPQTSNLYGAWLSRARNRKGMSVYELSAASGVTPPTIYAIEGGASQYPRTQTLEKLAEALGVSLPEPQGSAELEEKIRGIGRLTDFSPFEPSERPTDPGVYVLYDKHKQTSLHRARQQY